MHQPIEEAVFMIGRSKDDLTSVLECRVSKDEDGDLHYICTDGRNIYVPDHTRLFNTRDEAQKELDDLSNYFAMRLSHHKK